jgi:predicted nucleic acid-binding protein
VSKVFLDTNILIYAVDSRDPAKQDKAIDVFDRCMRGGTGVISTQVMQEYASAALSKLHQDVDVVVAEVTILESLEVVQLTPALIRRGLELHARHGIHFWDASILAAAELARCTLLWSEDFSPGSVYGMLRVENPLAKRLT